MELTIAESSTELWSGVVCCFVNRRSAVNLLQPHRSCDALSFGRCEIDDCLNFEIDDCLNYGRHRESSGCAGGVS